jgi:menaquinone-dependent protoporphyrinogen oxidase
MPTTTLIAYATKHESTQEVAEFVAGVLGERGLDVDVQPAGAVQDVERYDGVVIGGALYMGRWHRDARRLLHEQRAALAERPVFVFGMGPDKLDEPSVAGARRQLDHALRKIPEVRPAAIAVFGGVVHPDVLRFPFSRIPESDARDWDAIRAWAQDVAAVLGARHGATAAGG